MFWTALKNIYVKVAPILAVLIFLISVVVIIKLEVDLKSQQKTMQQSILEQKQFQDQIMRSQSTQVNQKDLDDFAKQLGFKLDDINKDLSSLHSKLDMVNNVTITTPGFNGSNLPSTNSTPNSNNPIPPQLPCANGICPNPDKYGYLNNIQTLKLNEPFSSSVNVPFGSVGFDASKASPWSETVDPRKYSITTVVGVDDNGKHTFYNQVQVTVDGKVYEIPISTATEKEVPPSNKWRFNPRLHLGLDIMANVANVTGNGKIAPAVAPELDVSLGSYGPTSTDPILTVGHLGVGLDLTPYVAPTFNISPIGFNVGHFLQPFMDNFILTPNLSINTKGDFAVGGSVKVGL